MISAGGKENAPSNQFDIFHHTTGTTAALAGATTVNEGELGTVQVDVFVHDNNTSHVGTNDQLPFKKCQERYVAFYC